MGVAAGGICALWLDMGSLDGKGRAVPAGPAEKGLGPDPGLVTPAAVLHSNTQTSKVRETLALELMPSLVGCCERIMELTMFGIKEWRN